MCFFGISVFEITYIFKENSNFVLRQLVYCHLSGLNESYFMG